MKDFNEQQRDFVNSMGRAFRSARDVDGVTVLFVGLGLFIAFIAVVYFLNREWHWIRGKWIFIKKYFEGRNPVANRRTTHYEVVIEPPYGPDRTLHTTTEDLSPTGMFMRMNPPLKKGEIFHFLLVLPDETRIDGHAEVKWAQHHWSEHHPSGNGCRFLNLKPELRNKIALSLKRKRH